MSLTEVLVALFILTLGVIGILTLFPLSAAQMAYAVRDDRSALAAINADNVMRWYWQTYVVENPGVVDKNFQPYTGLFDAPTNGLPSLTSNPNGQQLYQNWGQPSYPVLVDPMGYAVRQGTFGEAPGTQIQRCSLFGFNQAVSQPNVPYQLGVNLNPPQPQLQNFPYRFCSLVDTLGFNDNGTPTADLEMRYNWMWVLQRPQFINQQGDLTHLLTMNMTVVVFDRRPFLYPPINVTGFEVVFSNTVFTSGLTTVSVPLTSADQAQGLKAGSWVMDATTLPANPKGGLPYPFRQANFYRVVSVTTSGTNALIELQTPVTPPTGYSPTGFQWNGTLVVLNGVSGVFQRAPLTPRSN
jgi:hypothetical protein